MLNYGMRKIILMIIFIVFTSCSVATADIPAAFVDIGFGARPMSMGGAFTAVCDDAHAIFWNPAGLTLLKRNQLTAMYTKQFNLIPYTLGAYASRLGQHRLGLAVLSSGNDVLKETTIIASYANRLALPILGLTRFGGNFRYRASSFGNNEDGGTDRSQGSASGYAIDLGLLWQLNGDTRFGIYARDVINNMTYNNTTRKVKYSEDVPAGLIFGFSRKIKERAVLAFDWERSLYEDTADKLHLGAEVHLLQLFILRGGTWQTIDPNANRNYSLGLGIQVMRTDFGVQFDFAYLINDLANTPRISFSIYY